MTLLEHARVPTRRASRRPRSRSVKALLGCGIAYPVVYVIANDIVAARRYDGYSRVDQAVSELSAVGAPTRRFLAAMLPAWTLLTAGFGVGVWQAAAGRRSLRTAGAVLVVSGVTGVAWLPFPMSSRADLAAGAGSTNDTGHLVLSGLTGAEIVALLGAGSAAFGKKFRIYSLASGAVVLATGTVTAKLGAGLTQGKPSPGMGAYERAGMGAWMLWMAVLAVALLREKPPPSPVPPDRLSRWA